jgi:two-component system, chemotaxis family, chemotaxis protein CheY
LKLALAEPGCEAADRRETFEFAIQGGYMAYNILIVDDSETVRSVLMKTLRLAEVSLGEVYQANNGVEALAVLRANWIDLVLSDINMPIMNGLELVAAMKADKILLSIPVIIISTEGSQTRIDSLRAQGIAGFVRKPFTPESIKSAIDFSMASF